MGGGNARPYGFNLLIKCNDNIPREKRKRGDCAVSSVDKGQWKRESMTNLSSDQEHKGLETEHSS